MVSPFKHVAQKRINECERSGANIPALPHAATFCFQHLVGVFITTSSPAPPSSLRYIPASSSSQALMGDEPVGVLLTLGLQVMSVEQYPGGGPQLFHLFITPHGNVASWF